MSLSRFSSHFHWHCVDGECNRKREIISLWRNGRICFLYAALFRSECEATNRWQMFEWMEASEPPALHREVVGQRGGRVGCRKKKWWYLLFHPPLYSSRHGNMPGGHSREVSSLTKTTERQRVSERKRKQNRQTVCMNERREEKVGSRSTTDFEYLTQSLNMTFRDSAEKCNEHSFIIGGQAD